MKKILLALLPLALVGCNSSSDSDTSSTTTPPKPTPPPAPSLDVTIYSSIENCSTAADVPNCAFEKGIYVLKVDSTVTDEQQQRVIAQATNFATWASDSVKQQLNHKTFVIGIMMTEPNGPSEEAEFVVTLSQAKQIVDGVELVYTNIDGTDETERATTYQKLMQLFDYYGDDNQSHLLGQGLNSAYSSFKSLLQHQDLAASTLNVEALRFDECPYGNGQLSTTASERALGTDTPCVTEDDEEPAPNGQVDEIHEISGVNLNPGALLGLMYEYKVNPTISEGGGELFGSKGGEFQNIGQVGSGELDGNVEAMFNSWANPAFAPLNIYLDTYFLANKK
ncbi:histidine ammonia-lyase [Vibrio gigantis]|uniref:Histidine ammonia-lyase n=1 Tax=Vibrio gigantis TaxID=296199 RepID=A0A5M9N2H6_9VIBR|nr:histidine ammonia-lyase [Vibrio gigantis]KAA8666245.1 histidine ammonia-lyase [Vibrio gigantis]